MIDDAEKATVICLTPVKNEAWIIKRFLECSSLWADIIIIADQNSDDNTSYIASKFPKVRIVKNQVKKFNEPQRQKILLDEAKKIKGKKLIIALDADECLSANFLKSHEWMTLLNAEIGTYFSFDLINIYPGFNNYWKSKPMIRGGMFYEIPDFEPNKIIHIEKLPYKIGDKLFHCTEIKLLHYQYTDWKRMENKHNWYQVWETLHFPQKSSIDIYRMYHHMYSISKKAFRPLKESWFREYTNNSIDMFSVNREEKYYWEEKVSSYLLNHGPKRFSRIAIWHQEWQGFNDPRTCGEKFLHIYLKKSQPYYTNIFVKAVDRILKLIF